jgi:cardiolipin synthase
MQFCAHIVRRQKLKSLFNQLFGKFKDEFFTIPNILSMVRILLIPLIVYLYCFAKNYLLTIIVVAFSSLTDVVDGFIARKFNMITDFGKLIDPVADKATQIVLFACVSINFPIMLLPLAVLTVKELGSLALRTYVYKKTELVWGARWHGKASTTIIIVLLVLHLIWIDIPSTLSLVLVGASTAFMIYSGVLYTLEAFQMLRNYGKT